MRLRVCVGLACGAAIVLVVLALGSGTGAHRPEITALVPSHAPSLATLMQQELAKLPATANRPRLLTHINAGQNNLLRSLRVPQRQLPHAITGWSCAVATGSPCDRPARAVFVPERTAAAIVSSPAAMSPVTSGTP